MKNNYTRCAVSSELFHMVADSDGVLCYRASVLPKGLLGKSYTGWIAMAFPAVDGAGILYLLMVLACPALHE